MNAIVEQSEDKSLVRFDGALTIDSADQVRDALLRALENSPDVEINLDDITDIDLSCLQLICSAHRTSVTMQKNLTMTSAPEGVLQDAAGKAGFLRHTGCSLDARKNCLWVGIRA